VKAQGKAEVLLEVYLPLVGNTYEARNGNRYRLSQIVARLDSPSEDVILLQKLPQLIEVVACPFDWFRDGQFKRVYSFDEDLETLSLMVIVFENGLQYWAVSPAECEFVPQSIQSIPSICRRMKDVLAEVRGDRNA
jgi:hypothetical protein